MTLRILRSTSQVCCINRMSFNLDLSDFSLIVLFGLMSFLEKEHRANVLVSSHHTRNVHCYPDLLPLVLALIISLFFFLLSFYAALFERKSLCVAHTYGVGSCVLPPCGAEYLLNYWDSSAQEICFFSHIYLFIQSIFISRDLWNRYT